MPDRSALSGTQYLGLPARRSQPAGVVFVILAVSSTRRPAAPRGAAIFGISWLAVIDQVTTDRCLWMTEAKTTF